MSDLILCEICAREHDPSFYLNQPCEDCGYYNTYLTDDEKTELQVVHPTRKTPNSKSKVTKDMIYKDLWNVTADVLLKRFNSGVERRHVNKRLISTLKADGTYNEFVSTMIKLTYHCLDKKDEASYLSRQHYLLKFLRELF